jgi:hypothetical protein
MRLDRVIRRPKCSAIAYSTLNGGNMPLAITEPGRYADANILGDLMSSSSFSDVMRGKHVTEALTSCIQSLTTAFATDIPWLLITLVGAATVLNRGNLRRNCSEPMQR